MFILSFKENKLEKAASLQVLLFITFKLEINTGGPYLNLGFKQYFCAGFILLLVLRGVV